MRKVVRNQCAPRSGLQDRTLWRSTLRFSICFSEILCFALPRFNFCKVLSGAHLCPPRASVRIRVRISLGAALATIIIARHVPTPHGWCYLSCMPFIFNVVVADEHLDYSYEWDKSGQKVPSGYEESINQYTEFFYFFIYARIICIIYARICRWEKQCLWIRIVVIKTIRRGSFK